MPIGKNALKRVANNGYSSVATSAPDMEHSEVLAPETDLPKTAPETVEAETAPVAKTAPLVKPAPKKRGRPPKKAEPAAPASVEAAPVSSATKKTKKTETAKKSTAPKARKTKAETVTETSHPDGFVKVSFGMDLPVHLL